MIPFKEYVSDSDTHLKYHLDNNIPLHENVFRVGSQSYFELFQEARYQLSQGTYVPSAFGSNGKGGIPAHKQWYAQQTGQTA